jgi:hypothetical protein
MESLMKDGFVCKFVNSDVIQDSWKDACLVDEDSPGLMKGGFCMRKA